MKKFMPVNFAVAGVLVLTAVLGISYAQKNEFIPAEQVLFEQIVVTAQSWGKDPKIVSFVKAKNASGETLDQAKEQDKAWISTPGIDVFMKSILENGCSKYLRELRKTAQVIGEFYVMDLNGALVGATNKIADYWQGDEDMHIKTCQVGGAGATFIDIIKFDQSSQKFRRQISVPVIDLATGNAIGAITVGVDLDKLTKLSK
ncbi:MAG: hypothetical protein ABIH27_02695 [Candidatus Omnitrophota bacterium]